MLKVGTLFSGIGSIEFALRRLNIKHEVVFACDNGGIDLKKSLEEITKEYNSYKDQKTLEDYVEHLYISTNRINYVKQSYIANYGTPKEGFFSDVRFFDGKRFKGKIDLLAGGSPCQSFSVNGKHLGLEDARGTLFYDFARIVKQVQPKIFIFENVPGLLSHDKGNTWSIISSIFSELGYKWKYTILNSRNFNIPQNRRRLFVVGFINEFDYHKFNFPKGNDLTLSAFNFLEQDIDDKYFLPKKGFEYTTNKKNKKRVSIESSITRCQAANQQFNWCGDFYFVPIDNVKILKNAKAYAGKFNDKVGYIRKLTPREILRLMGYDDSFKVVVNDNEIYHQSGNSIVVNVLEAILNNIYEKN
jgi:DNA (cytosine-5)-methyltransferase 1